MQSLCLSIPAARRLMLAAQGLLDPPPVSATKADVLSSIRRMGALQIDTIHVVARSPYLVLWSRLGAYDPRWLDALLAEGHLFEYWAHAACFLPKEEYPFYRRRMLTLPTGWLSCREWIAEHADLAGMVMARITQEGGLKSANFEHPRENAGGWWNWKDEKTALECLFYAGELMVARRENFQRVYDLTARIRPDWDGSQPPAEDELFRHQVLQTVDCLGVALPAWIPDYFRLPKTETKRTVEALAAEGALVPVEIEGWQETAYVTPARLELAQRAAAGDLTPHRVTLLSPFDPLVWDRARARQLFAFDYGIECYLPAEKRRYGYFSLPILRRDTLMGRLDAKAHRADGVFEVRALFLEDGVAPDGDLWRDLAGAIRACAVWHLTPQVRLPETAPDGLSKALQTGDELDKLTTESPDSILTKSTREL